MIKEKDNNSGHTSFPGLEREVDSFWKEAQIFEKSVVREAPQGDYTFYDGPPFATGTPHYGHIVGQVIKDAVPRYFTMKGYRVERKWGWDCHGLPIENIIEKEMGTKTKKDIEAMGVGKFNDACRSKVLGYTTEWYEIARKLGRFVDTSHPYRTMDLEYMESVWWVFSQLWEKGLIYKDYRSMHVCPRCETTLAQSEVSEGYQMVKDLSCIAKFELVDEPGTYILAWTTTPWTLIGNVALAVGKEIIYAKIESENIRYLVAKERLADVFIGKEYSVIEEIPGSQLLGKAYKPLFDYYYNDAKLENHDRGWKIYAADFVTTEDGTGVVHIAPAFGENDMDLGKAEKLPFIQHVSIDGYFKPEVKDFPGLNVKPAGDHTATDIEIIKYLAHAGLLFSKAKYEHSYPHCWRCDTPLLNYATSSWFVNVTKIKSQLLEYAKDINWSPSYIKEGRFGNWLEGARDWSISRQRFWASAIPIWECACGERKVISSVKELEELSGQTIDDIHKDKVDDVVFPCKQCGGTMKRVSDVLDCWFESASMPYSQLHYPFENKEKLQANFPAQFIAEGVDQTRTWFYYLHVVSGGLMEGRAFNNVIVNGIVQAEDGKKMSKKLKNYPDPAIILDTYGADALRMYLMSSPVVQAENLNFSEKGVQESLRKNVMLLWNIYKFYEPYKENKQVEAESDNVLDIWLEAKFRSLAAEVTRAMEAYDLPRAVRPITSFIDEFSTWYIRRSRDRFKSEDVSEANAVAATTAKILMSLSRLIAPFMPFMAEQLYQKVSGRDFGDKGKSVHLEGWFGEEEYVLSAEQTQCLADMERVRRIVEAGLAQRDALGIKVRQALAGAKVKGSAPLPEPYVPLILDELNIKGLEFVLSEGELEVELDANITPELRQEGIKRELVRLINSQRKAMGLTVSDQVQVAYRTDSADIKESIARFQEELSKDVAAKKIYEVSGDDLPIVSINGENMGLRVELL